MASLAQLLYGHGANILDSDQHSDPEAGMFFQRLRFDTSELHTDKTTLNKAIEEVAARFELSFRLRFRPQPFRVAILVSRYDHCLIDLLWRHRSGELACEIPLVMSNHSDLESLVQPFDIPFFHVAVTKSTKTQAETEQLRLLSEHNVDLIVLARYMQILTGEFIAQYPSRIINIHHSFLPAFAGGRPYHQAYSRGVKLIGATAHYATAELDEGPIIEQSVVRCSHKDDVNDLVRKGRDLEKVVLSQAVRWHIEDRILVYGNKTVVFD